MWLLLYIGFVLIAPVGLEFLAVGVFGRRGKLRRPLIVLGIVLVLPGAYLLVRFVAPEGGHEVRKQLSDHGHAWTLDAPRRISGVLIPQGSTLEIRDGFDMANKMDVTLGNVEEIHLPAPGDLFGVHVRGVARHWHEEWHVGLVGVQRIDGWPCTGTIGVTHTGKLLRCRLARPQVVFGYRVPADTTVSVAAHGRISFAIPGEGISLQFDADSGKLVSAHMSHWPHAFHGAWDVPPAINRMAVDFDDHQWVLTHDMQVSGSTIAAGSSVEAFAPFDASDKSRLTLHAVSVFDLRAPAIIHGVRVQGRVVHVDGYWKGELAAPQRMAGWPCGGAIEFTDKGEVRKCTFSQPHVVHGCRVPARTEVSVNVLGQGLEYFDLPDAGSLSFDAKSGQLRQATMDGEVYFRSSDGDAVPRAIAAMRVEPNPS